METPVASPRRLIRESFCLRRTDQMPFTFFGTLTQPEKFMQVQIQHHDAQGNKADFGVHQLTHMPPVGEPFPIDDDTFYIAKAYFGPDHSGLYLLVLEGEPQSIAEKNQATSD